MRTHTITWAVTALLVGLAITAAPTVAAGQGLAPQTPVANQGTSTSASADLAIVPLRIEVTLSRYDGEKRIESLPFALSVNASGNETTLSVANRIQAPMLLDGKEASYNIGTIMAARATALQGGRFDVSLTVNDTSAVVAKDSTRGSAPILRSFSASNHLILRDGQRAQLASARDKMSGEVTNVDVTLNVVK